jgi:alpha-tubulin suppressor-like RCC1 family protein
MKKAASNIAVFTAIALLVLLCAAAAPAYGTTPGGVKGWGDNSTGELGDGTNNNSTTPVQASGIGDVIAIAGGDMHTVALKSDGTVWAWGDNSKGELGNATNDDSNTPVQVSNLSGVVAVDAGNYYSIALKSDGTVWTWGDNSTGVLGNATNDDSNTPVQVEGLTGMTSVAAGYGFALAVKDDGTVWAWGTNASGQLGNGGYDDTNAPVQASGISDAIGVAAGYEHSVALRSGGTLMAWGSNSLGQFGNNSTTDSDTPVDITTITGVKSVSAGDYDTVVLKYDGTVWAWGLNSDGQLGDSSYTTRYLPVQVYGLTGVTAVVAGNYHTLAIGPGAAVWAWGWNGLGQLGDGTYDDSNEPLQVGGLPGSSGVGAGLSFSLSIDSDTTPPASAITDPSGGASLSGTVYTITGTADDGAGSGVAGVGVSTNGGVSWTFADYSSGTWSYDWTLPPRGKFNIRSRATDNAGNVETPGAGVTVTVSSSLAGNPQLQHYDWNYTFGDSCAKCHVATGGFLSVDFMQRPGWCTSCHNAASVGHGCIITGPNGHSMFVNASSAGRMPSYGLMTTARYNDQPFARLDAGEVTCMTCHNPMDKFEDYGRAWESTSTADRQTFTLDSGPWAKQGRLVPRVYRTSGAMSRPTNSRTSEDYRVGPSDYVYNEYSGTITFTSEQQPTASVYVTLDYPYLRASSMSNTLCADCHTQKTHMGVNCLVCHTAHNTGNIGGVRTVVRAPDRTELPVVFMGYSGAKSFADGDTTYDGICEVCHTSTLYHRRDGSGSAHHDGGNCTTCHSHAAGFAG